MLHLTPSPRPPLLKGGTIPRGPKLQPRMNDGASGHNTYRTKRSAALCPARRTGVDTAKAGSRGSRRRDTSALLLLGPPSTQLLPHPASQRIDVGGAPEPVLALGLQGEGLMVIDEAAA